MKNLTRFQFKRILAEEYDTHSYLRNKKDYLKETGLLVYYAIFYYFKQKGYKYIFLSKEFIDDSGIDINEYIKNKCYQWALQNYGELKNELRRLS